MFQHSSFQSTWNYIKCLKNITFSGKIRQKTWYMQEIPLKTETTSILNLYPISPFLNMTALNQDTDPMHFLYIGCLFVYQKQQIQPP